ncbi:hypothetical protein K458DRAFT_392291 [Lentithecium fluviatile CBS 122367]|uniref:Uncharacterized protein n=1 Tax=Lentithecium fluviatile CBS 122367 TaxID=1168545 RepID=A0A6G1IS54_9PLEO|nr:hypothetical protein K458DRAFT_392291 [Lentithecium fluviatile CBS 122367]
MALLRLSGDLVQVYGGAFVVHLYFTFTFSLTFTLIFTATFAVAWRCHLTPRAGFLASPHWVLVTKSPPSFLPPTPTASTSRPSSPSLVAFRSCSAHSPAKESTIAPIMSSGKTINEFRIEATEKSGKRSALPCWGCIKAIAKHGVLGMGEWCKFAGGDHLWLGAVYEEVPFRICLRCLNNRAPCLALPLSMISGLEDLEGLFLTATSPSEAEVVELALKEHDRAVRSYKSLSRDYPTKMNAYQTALDEYAAGHPAFDPQNPSAFDWQGAKAGRPPIMPVEPLDPGTFDPEAIVLDHTNEERQEANATAKGLCELICAQVKDLFNNQCAEKVLMGHNGALKIEDRCAQSGVYFNGRERSKAALRKRDFEEDDEDSPRKKSQPGKPCGVGETDLEVAERKEQERQVAQLFGSTPDSRKRKEVPRSAEPSPPRHNARQRATKGASPTTPPSCWRKGSAVLNAYVVGLYNEKFGTHYQKKSDLPRSRRVVDEWSRLENEVREGHHNGDFA